MRTVSIDDTAHLLNAAGHSTVADVCVDLGQELATWQQQHRAAVTARRIRHDWGATRDSAWFCLAMPPGVDPGPGQLQCCSDAVPSTIAREDSSWWHRIVELFSL
jgi:hypothetical protein